ncbi:hypothetical protein BSQ39_05295 [Loigolactobacillus backii]|uniref:glycosyltransferase family 2 protein n=1 Tax=Loigolactobacillus backii TaxID=375175 RepID=UPI000C1CB59A|nr:glycosyltransferase family 2 protein [Loigolactobacillus backii]PIO83028.1 hypothetical protein BSQ39_05295 [Loigolactobacillus backii]
MKDNQSIKNGPIINICMSTYNGEQFIQKQIESIQNQDYMNWRLLVRDDGSNDDTIKIIKYYSSRDSRIHFMENSSLKHMGVKKSFFALSFIQDADYYMFSDQDDIWKPSKISVTLHEMNKHDQKRPLLVHTNYSVFNMNTNNARVSTNTYHNTNFKSLLLANNITGCTCMFNKALRDMLMKDEIPYNKIIMHDWWLAIVASNFGEVYFIDESTIYYRQHANNVVGAPRHNFLKKIGSRILGKDSFNIEGIAIQAEAFYSIYNMKMSGSNRHNCEIIANLVVQWRPIHQLAKIVKNSLFMNSGLKNIQFMLYIFFPLKMRKSLFGRVS